MFLRAASGPGGRFVDPSEEDAPSLEEKLGGWGLLYRLTKSVLESVARRKERAGWGVFVVGAADERSVVDEAGGSSSGSCC